MYACRRGNGYGCPPKAATDGTGLKHIILLFFFSNDGSNFFSSTFPSETHSTCYEHDVHHLSLSKHILCTLREKIHPQKRNDFHYGDTCAKNSYCADTH